MNVLGAGLVNSESGDCLAGRVIPGQLRRADRFCKMAICAARGALDAAQVKGEEQGIGVIMATAFGPHPTTFKFLDNILDYKENEVSPTLFSHSVHNAALSYIAAEFQINGPTLTVTGFDGVFCTAFQLANAWLDRQTCKYVLLGAAEERGPVFDKVFDIVEGSAFFLLGQGPRPVYLENKAKGPVQAGQEKRGSMVAALNLYRAYDKGLSR